MVLNNLKAIVYCINEFLGYKKVEFFRIFLQKKKALFQNINPKTAGEGQFDLLPVVFRKCIL